MCVANQLKLSGGVAVRLLSREAVWRAELATQPEFEREELAQIYVGRGASPAHQVADQLMAKDALGAHARDELRISEVTTARSRRH